MKDRQPRSKKVDFDEDTHLQDLVERNIRNGDGKALRVAFDAIPSEKERVRLVKQRKGRSR